MAPSPSERERVGVRVRICSRMIRARASSTLTARGGSANIFDERLKALSGGKLSINQFPGAQLGTEPQTLQKLRAGDIDFVITATANAASVAPQAGVFSLHFIFRDENHLAKALADKQVS